MNDQHYTLKGHIYLIGMMGSGKSTIGARLSQRLKLEHFDTDALIVQEHRKSISNIITLYGEEHFRLCESLALSRLSQWSKNVVASTGGGIVLAEENRVLLHDTGMVFWLQSSPAVLAERLQHDSSRPLLPNDAKRRLSAISLILSSREQLYAETAHKIVEVENKTPDMICEEIEEALK